MPSTFSPSLRLELIGDGDQSGIWGQTTNNNLGGLIEQSIAGVISISMLDANYTLTNFNGVVDEARNQVLIVGGTNSAPRNIIAPMVEKTYIIRNQTIGGQTIQIIGSSGLGVIIPNGVTASVYCDGTNFYRASTGTTGNYSVNGNLNVTGTTALTGALTASTAAFSGAISSVSPSFTGTPVAPTATAGTNTTQIATTAFVQATAAGLGLGTIATQNANNVNITGGSLTGMTNVAGGTHSGTTATFSGAVSGGSGVFSGAVSGTTGTFSGAVSGTTGTFSGAMSAASLSGTAATGSGASGTWGIAITGNAASATNATNSTNATTVTGATQSNITSIPNLATVGTITSGTWSGSFGAVSGANLTTLNANNLASGTVPSARLSGTYNINISGNATTATSATSATSATNASTANAIANAGGWAVTPSGTKLFFSYNGVNKGSLDSSGNFIVTGNVTAFGTP